MVFFVIAGVLLFIALLLLETGTILGKDSIVFESNKRIGKAEVVGYEHQSSHHTMLVRLPELNDGKIYSCVAGKIRTSDYPKGAVVDVYYAPEKVAGINIVEVHLNR